MPGVPVVAIAMAGASFEVPGFARIVNFPVLARAVRCKRKTHACVHVFPYSFSFQFVSLYMYIDNADVHR